MRQPVPADELTRARNLEALSFPGAFETTERHGRQPLANWRSTACRSRSSASTCRRFRRSPPPTSNGPRSSTSRRDKFAVVVVGDLSKIEKPIRAANFGPVKVVTLDEILK